MLHIPSNFYYPIYYEQNDTSRGIMLKSLQGGSIIITECLMKIRPFISSWNLVVVIASTLHPPLMLHLQIWLPTLQVANNLTQLEGYFKTVRNKWIFMINGNKRVFIKDCPFFTNYFTYFKILKISL